MKRRDPAPLVFSVVVHVLAATAILTAAFHYDFSRDRTIVRAPHTVEKISYITVAPAGGITRGNDSTSAPDRARNAPRGLVAPIAIPPTVTPPAAPSMSGPAGGVQGGKGRAQMTAITGIVPSQIDPRLTADPHAFYPEPKTHAERVDSAVRASIYAYNDSVERALAARGKAPGDWTYEKNGQKWGMDGRNIYLGKFAIPSAVLAALPIRLQGNPGEGFTDRLAPSRRADILLHAESQFHEDEFKDAIKRIRERKDRERAEKQADAARTPPSVPLIP